MRPRASSRDLVACRMSNESLSDEEVAARVRADVSGDFQPKLVNSFPMKPDEGYFDLVSDEDIAMLDTLDTLTPSSFPSCNSSPTHLPCHSQIQQTRRQCFGHNFFIRHRNRVILDSLDRGR